MSDPIITFDHVVKEFKTRGRTARTSYFEPWMTSA